MLRQIPTNIVTGFLGSGKTTAILNLLKHKPVEERWAVLVNEFGEVGIDGALLQGSGAYIKEVPGGCMCCVTGVPMQVGLNTLLQTAKPDRLLIEPTGLGHASEIFAILQGDTYRSVIDLRATVVLIDPRKLGDERYVRHDSFKQQLAVADVLVANKTDLCGTEHRRLFEEASARLQPSVVCWTQQGVFDSRLLDQPAIKAAQVKGRSAQGHRPHPLAPPLLLGIPAPKPGEYFSRKENRGQGCYSCGWVFDPACTFNFDDLFALFSGIVITRLKAVMITDEGIFAFNSENGVLSVAELDEAMDSRVEGIDFQARDWGEIEDALFACAEVPDDAQGLAEPPHSPS